MDYLSYNGLLLNIVQTNRVERDPILDPSDSTYLYTRWRGDFVVTYSPGAINYSANNGQLPTLNAQSASGTMPPVTDVAIRAWLERPRGQLVFSSLGNKIITSPGLVNGVYATCDATTGPIVRVNSIDEVQGERMWKIHLLFETCIRENPQATSTNVTSTSDLIISNRWSVTHDVNWQHLTTRNIRGVCTVRGDVLRSALTAPNTGLVDALRNQFAAFSVPQNFQRTAVNVTVTPDGNSAHYSVTDTERLWNIIGQLDGKVPRIEVVDTNWMWKGSWGRAAAAGVNQGMMAYAPSWWAYGLAIPTFGLSLGLSGGYNAYTATMSAIQSQLPKHYKQCIVRAWGDNRRYRYNLTDLALKIATTRMGSIALFDTTTSEIIVSGDTANYVTVQYTIHWDYQTQIAGLPVGAIQAFTGAQVGVNPGPGNNAWVSNLFQDTKIGTLSDVVMTQDNGTNPNFLDIGTTNPNSGGVRGTYLGNAVTQTLESFNASPAAVP